MRIALGCDHGGFALKEAVVAHLQGAGHDVDDLGTHATTSVDYPDYAKPVAERVRSGAADRGVLLCGTGQGMAMAANKVPGVRAGCVSDATSARLIVQHNNALVLCLGARIVGEELAVACLDAWLSATFEGGRHARRVGKIEAQAHPDG